jgi:hypothetical protein
MKARNSEISGIGYFTTVILAAQAGGGSRRVSRPGSQISAMLQTQLQVEGSRNQKESLLSGGFTESS